MKDGRLQASDLMIGDWAKLSKGNWFENRKVELIDIEMIAESVYLAEPIPITPEILDKNGFEASKDFNMRYWSKSYDEFIKVSELEEGRLYLEAKGKKGRYEGDCNFLHELQHALRLCEITLNIDKKIEL